MTTKDKPLRYRVMAHRKRSETRIDNRHRNVNCGLKVKGD